MHDVRHNGRFVARFESEEDAYRHASLHGDEFSVEPGRPFELHCEDGFIDSFHSEEEAKAAMEQHSKRFKELSVKSEGETLAELSVEVADPNQDLEVGEPAKPLTESESSELPTDPAPPEPETSPAA